MKPLLKIISVIILCTWASVCYAKPPDAGPKKVTNVFNNTEINNTYNQKNKTDYIVGGEARIHDSKKWKVKLFADYSTNSHNIDKAGIKFMFKFGKSYEEKEIDKLKKEMKELNENLTKGKLNEK